MIEEATKPQHTWWSILLGITIEGGFVILGSIAIEHLLNADRQEVTSGTLGVAIGTLLFCIVGTVGALIWARSRANGPQVRRE